MSVIYPIGALICRITDERMGFEGIKQLFSDSEFYSALEKVLKVKKAEFPAFVRKELSKY